MENIIVSTILSITMIVIVFITAVGFVLYRNFDTLEDMIGMKMEHKQIMKRFEIMEKVGCRRCIFESVDSIADLECCDDGSSTEGCEVNG